MNIHMPDGKVYRESSEPMQWWSFSYRPMYKRFTILQVKPESVETSPSSDDHLGPPPSADPPVVEG